ncbi:MAG: TROVE domain-containing protein [Synergistaceae bacterium]|nr:TROVE domain-containing protein [Synergistaceae bacterium]
MTYQGKKCREQTRLMKKKSIIDEDQLMKPQKRGTVSTGKRIRYMKRHDRRVLEELRRETSSRLREEAAEFLRLAKFHEPYCPEHAQYLAERAERLTRIADWAAKNYTGSCGSVYLEYDRQHEISAEPALSDDPMIATLARSIRKSGVRNFMAGISYEVSPLDTLKMISASSVFGEPQYYRDGENSEATILDGRYGIEQSFMKYSLREMDSFKGMNTSQVMEKAIDDALTADFGGVLEWAVELRDRYMMRLNPQIIMVRAAVHPGREAFTSANPGKFSEIAQRVMFRGDDVINQLQYWLFSKGSKNGIPAVLKRSWAKRIAAMNAYSMSKYGHAGIGLVDTVRICHAKGPLVDTLMKDGRVPMPEGSDTWERLRASGKSWLEVLRSIHIPHMALLRNLRGIFSEVEDERVLDDVLENLKAGVLKGRQFPFRYLSAKKAIDEAELFSPRAKKLKDTLEECMNISCGNLPLMPGRCAFLTDNSGSAWGTCTSEYGTMHVAEISNLSSVIGAMCANEGVVFPFGDRLGTFEVSKGRGLLEQSEAVSTLGKSCGFSTENGVWLFFRHAILSRQHWDNIFIYSDMQAGHGGLYGENPEEYRALGCCLGGGWPYIDVNRLVEIYRSQVNPRVNVYCIQTAGYTNVLVPEYGYRTAVLYGWTGKELIFADAMRRIWDGIEGRGD